MEFDNSLLPPTAHKIIDLIGLPSTFALIKKHGGKRVRLARSGARFDSFAAVIGAENTEKLIDHFGVSDFTIPLCRDALNELRNARIREEFDRLTMTERRSSNFAIHELVELFSLSEKQVRRILNTAGRNLTAAAVDELQMTLL